MEVTTRKRDKCRVCGSRKITREKDRVTCIPSDPCLRARDPFSGVVVGDLAVCHKGHRWKEPYVFRE